MGEVKVWSHNVSLTFYRLTSLWFHVNRPSHSWDTTFFIIWPWKSKVKVMAEVKVESHKVGVTYYRLISLSFHVNQPSIPEIQHFQNLTLKIQGQGHGWEISWKSQHGSNIVSTHIPFILCQSAIPFLRYDYFIIWPWKSNVKVTVEVKVESQKVGVTSYRLTSLSFHVNWPSHSWDTAFSKFDLENPRSRWWVRGTLKVTKWV